MIKSKVFEKVSRIDTLEGQIIIGVDTNIDEDGTISHGNKILRLLGDLILESKDIKFFYFIPFKEGILYYGNEGDPIFYYDFRTKITKQITSKNYFFSPSQIRSDFDKCVIVHMDEQFNQTYYLLQKDFNKILLPQFPKILLIDNFIFFNKNVVENYSLSTLDLQWAFNINPTDQVERQYQGGAVFSDGKYVFIRLKGGRLQCLTLSEGIRIWELENDIKQVSFNEEGDFLYIHKGDGFCEVDKNTGVTTRSLNYKDIKGLEGYNSNGIIWSFKDIVVTRNSFTGDLAVFNRDSFELINREVVDQGIPESKDCIRFVGGYLYVLSTSGRIHVFGLND